ncbi:hypothetical protein HHI36_006102 [Cryptolaemus montrouzieri]|uniref:Uncharacterized protein n=1 Tax=Cryptolaemus montrouzieri TaxID=559131 RepID=A0ABD2NWA5_9CUCU
MFANYSGRIQYDLYYAYSHLIYLAALWGQGMSSDIKELQVVQNRALKIIFNLPKGTGTLCMYKDLHLLMIEEIIKLDSVKLIYKINNMLEAGVGLVLKSDLHGYNTRTKQYFHILPSAINKGHRRITSRSAIWYNKRISRMQRHYQLLLNLLNLTCSVNDL